MKKRILSLLLVFIITCTCMPIHSFATTEVTNPSIVVEGDIAAIGATVDVKVLIKNNPGVAGAKLTVSYNEKLELVSASSGEAFSNLYYTRPNFYTSPCNFNWDSESGEVTEDGVVLNLKFIVLDDAEPDELLDVNVSYRYGDIYDENLESLKFDMVNGYVTVLNYIPGDVNEDGLVNGKDVTLIRRYNAGDYGVSIREEAADVNDDDLINGKDVTLIRRYHAGGYGVQLLPHTPRCSHVIEAVEAKKETCTEDGNIAYWYCNVCEKYFGDELAEEEISVENTVIEATGHTEVVDEAVAPDYDNTGLTEGSHCAVCNEVIIAQKIIPQLKKSEYSITYNIANNDAYLAGLEINNSNPSVYTKEDGLKLSNLNVEGYIFDGWYDAAGASGELVKEIPVGTTGNIELYARWSLVEYTVQFDSPDLPVESIKYTVNTGVPLINPAKQFGYTFVGWSNDDGFLVSRIKPGTTGHITLHANWTSNRNKATSYSSYEKPIIIEDDTNGQFLFVYNIGKIDNVPLNQISYLGNSDGIEINQEYDVSNSISRETAEKVANTVANATTKSSGWTLSDEWETVFSVGNEIDEQKGKTEVRTDAEGNVTGGNYFVSNSSGGSSFVSNSSGGSNSSTSKVTTANSHGINGAYDNKNESYIDAKLGVSNTTSVGAEVGVDIPCTPVEVGASIENSTTVSAEVAGGLRNTNSVHVDESKSSYIGTYNENNSSSYYNSTIENSSTWNSTSGYENSYQSSRNTEISNAISEQISKKTSLNVMDATGGSKSTNASDSYTNSNSEEYSSSVRYNSEEKTSSKQSFKYSSSEQGYYRLVNAGTVHVFAVVGYDVATSSYFTYTYNVLDDERHIYTDFSLSDPNFNDCENGVVTFEIPYEVNEYVAGLTGKSAGLQFGLDGTVTKYTTSKNDTVVVPQYYSANNTDNSYTAVKVTKISAEAFKGNTSIKTIVLPLYVTEIPEGAFENCTNLETVIAYGVTKIGANAFKGCSNLKTFAIDNKVVSLGTNAFEGVNEIMVNAANVNVADSTINSGAKRVTLSIARMEGSFDNKIVTVSDDFEYFAFYGNGSPINNLQIDSSAKESVINNMILSGNKDTPIKLNSEKITLNRVTIKSAPGFAIISTADNALFNLYSSNNISSAGENTMLCKNIELLIANKEVASNLNVNGHILTCGSINDNEKLLNITNGEVKIITEDEFNAYLTTCKVLFNANGGAVDEVSREVFYGNSIGTLPTPTMTGYTFDGWYTDDGVKVTENTIIETIGNFTLTAKWNINIYYLTWYNGENCTILANRISSPIANAEIGAVTYGDMIYYGDVLEFSYIEHDYYHLTSSGITSITVTGNVDSSMVYATAELNPLSDWTNVAYLPAGARVDETKWSYHLRLYESTTGWLSGGWVHYDTVLTDWGETQGPVYNDPSNGERHVWSEQYVTSSNYKTVYCYYRYAASRTGGNGAPGKSSSYPNYYEYEFDSPLDKTTNVTFGGSSWSRWKYWYSSSNWCGVYGETAKQVWVSDNYATRWYYKEPIYTYYFYQDFYNEADYDPTGQQDVSNVVKLVRYREK